MSAGNRIDVWDGWRGLAILLVLVGHFTFSGWVWEERMGVDVFFVLSGMLMSNILFIKRMNLTDFYVRRFSRVIPALVVFLIAAGILSMLLKYDFSVKELIASLFFIRTYYPVEPVYFTSPVPTGHLWSLSVEEHSYILMSLLSVLLIASRKVAWVLLGIFAVSIAVNVYNNLTMDALEFKYSLIRTESTIGFIAFSAAYNLIKKEHGITLPPHMPAILVLLAFFCYLDSAPLWMTYLLCPVLLGVSVNHLTESAPVVQKLLSQPPLRWIGVLSYSIYLWQQIFYKLYYAIPGGVISGFILSISFGAASFYFLENPVRQWLNQRFSPTPHYRETRDQ